MTEEDAIHFHRLCELRGELVKMKEERDSLQHMVELLNKDCDQYRKELAKAYNTISNLQGDVDDARSEACGLALDLRQIKKEFEKEAESGYEKDPFG